MFNLEKRIEMVRVVLHKYTKNCPVEKDTYLVTLSNEIRFNGLRFWDGRLTIRV